MNILDNTQLVRNRVIIDFGVVDDEDYRCLCATSFSLQGIALQSNERYTQVEVPKWMFWRKTVTFTKERVTAAFEFPSQALLDMWLEILPRYVSEEPRVDI